MSEDSDDIESMFNRVVEEHDTIFRNKELLRIGHVPKKERIVGRDEELEKIIKQLHPVVKNQSPNNCLIYGKTGTGKSLVSRLVVKEAKRQAQKQGYNVGTVYVDCSEKNTHTRATRHIALTLNKDELLLDIPRSGIGSGEYYSYIWEILDKLYDSTLIILDEIDKLGNDDILMQLSRAREAQKTETNLGIVAISNKIQYRDRLSERVKSSLDARDFIFHPYDAEELRQILEHRKDAFYDEVLSSDVIPVVAALSAREHGDARKAIEILRNAGMIAEEERSKKIKEEHVQKAKERAEMNRFYELIKGSTQHVKLVLYTLSQMTIQTDKDMFNTGDVYEKYREACHDYGTDPLSEYRVYELLKEQAFLGVVESKKESEGRGKGIYLRHRLVTDPTIVKKVISQTTELPE